MKLIWLCSITLLAAGCASVPEALKFKNLPAPAAQADKALIVVYRENRFAGSGVDLQIYEDGQRVGVLPNGSYVYFYTSPGHKTLVPVAWNLAAVEYSADFESGQIYYLKSSFNDRFLTAQVSLVAISADAAKKDLSDLQSAETADHP